MNTLKKAAALAAFAAPLALAPTSAFADPTPSITFTQTLGNLNDGEHGTEVHEISGGGFITVGVRNTVTDDVFHSDLLLVKADASGNELWTRYFGGTADDYGNSVVQTADGGFVATGYTTDELTGDTQMFVVKVDTNGNTVWTHTYGDATSGDSGNSIKLLEGGSFIIAGSVTTADGDLNQALWKLDSSGNLLWTSNFGSVSTDTTEEVILTSDGGYLVVGSSYGHFGYSSDVFVSKTNASGTLQWSKFYGTADDDRGFDVLEDSGSFVITGSTGVMSGYSIIRDVLIIKTDLSGNQTVGNTFGSATGDEWGSSIIKSHTGGYVIAGTAPSSTPGNGMDQFLLFLSPTGAPQWTQTVGTANADLGFDIATTSDGGYIMTGYTSDYGADDLTLVKLN